MNPIDAAFYAMDAALRDPAAVPLEYNPQGYNTGLSVTLSDLERLFPLMAKAAALFRLHDGPAPEGWADTWNGTASKCAAVCREASTVYLSLCTDKGQPIAGERRERLDSWEYMAALFSSWPAKSGCTAAEPPRITAEAASEPVEASTGAGIGKPLYYLKTAHNRQELARIFCQLVEAGFIDGSSADAQADFLNAFDPAAEKQGRIAWIWADKRQHHPVQRHILDFVAQMDGGSLYWTTPELYNKTAPAIFGLTFDPTYVSKYHSRWTHGKYCETHAEIAAIVTGV